MTEYAIQPLSLRCAQTGREMKPGEVYYSVLSESPDGFVRTDFCAEAWTGPPPGAIGFWRSVVSQESRQRRTLVDDSVLMDCFTRLAESDDAYKRNFRFILALLLMRRKVLKLAGSTRENGVDVLVLRAPASDEEHHVVNPDLTEEQLAAMQAEVEKVLHSSVG
jgi:hypothetical protein